ncbi:cytochrome b/b6 domain-containing protein [Microbacterium sp. HJ5]
MATFSQTIRRGLPRRPGGEPWPPAGEAPVAEAEAVAASPGVGAPEASATGVAEADRASSLRAPQQTEALSQETGALAAPAVPTPAAAAPAAVPAAPGARRLRRGLPRVLGGEPWPPASAPAPVVVAATTVPASVDGATSLQAPQESEAPAQETGAVPAPIAPAPAQTAARVTEPAMRRGLPRTPGGDAWPPPGLFAAAPMTKPALPVAEPALPAAEASLPAPTPAAAEPGLQRARAATAVRDYSAPLPFTRTVWLGAAARTRPEPKREPRRLGRFTLLEWAGIVVVGGGGLLYAGLMAVFAVRWLLSTQWGVDFLAAYPGEYHLPEGAPVGIPAWLGWQHFFNVFLMVLIIRSGLQVRTEKRPSVFWSPRNNGRRKISLNLWFHQSLDILWIVNGVVFVVLLFLTGQWMRIVPTSWEVFPNAISAGLQYVSLDWPTENGWVNYNSLQQLAYFATVFLAAPLAIVTGVRMSGVWPKNAKTLNRIYPVEWARAIHFPVMLYFVLFIFVHVVLVFATGALRNLNHMYAAQGSTDPDAYLMNWTGFWIFGVSIVVIVIAWIAARPLVLAPIARLFGKVSGR